MSSQKKSGMLGNLKDAYANFEMLIKQMEDQSTELTEKMEQLDDDKEELKAQNLELQAERDMLIAEQLKWKAKNKGRSSSFSDPNLEILKAKLEAERAKLEAEKTQLRIAQSQLMTSQLQLEDAKNQLENARSELETAREHLEDALAETEINNKMLEAAKTKLQAAKISFDRATKQLNAAKIKFEDAKKTLEDAAAANYGSKNNTANEELAAELSQSKAQIEILCLTLRDLERQSCQDKQSFQEKLEEMKKQISDQDTKARKIVNDADVELSKSKTQIENLSRKLRDQEDQCVGEKRALTLKVDELEKKLAEQETKVTKTINPKVFFDICNSKGDTFIGRVVIEVFSDTSPRLGENFRALCTGEKGVGRNHRPLCYKGSYFGFYDCDDPYLWGSIENGESIYGESLIPIENFKRDFTDSGDVVMANGPNGTESSGTDFFINFTKRNDWKGKLVVIGHVVEGLNILTDLKKAPSASRFLMANCGQIS